MTPASVTTPREKSTTIRGVVGRIVVLSLTLVSAIYEAYSWGCLGCLKGVCR